MAGGYRSTRPMADLARALGLPVILVIGVRLGCLNHALLTAEAIARDGLPLAGWVANTLDPEMPRLGENIDALGQRLRAPCLGCVPFLADPSPSALAQYLSLAPLIPKP